MRYYEDLAAKLGPTERAFEWRMQNISSVMSLMGRGWLQGLKPPKNVGAKVTQLARDPAVKAWILGQANGVCECCNRPAPFNGADGEAFLEVHHVRRVAEPEQLERKTTRSGPVRIDQRPCASSGEHPGSQREQAPGRFPEKHGGRKDCQQLVGPGRADPTDAAGVETRFPGEARQEGLEA